MLAYLQRLRDPGEDERRVAERCERYPGDAVGEAVGRFGGRLQG